MSHTPPLSSTLSVNSIDMAPFRHILPKTDGFMPVYEAQPAPVQDPMMGSQVPTGFGQFGEYTGLPYANANFEPMASNFQQTYTQDQFLEPDWTYDQLFQPAMDPYAVQEPLFGGVHFPVYPPASGPSPVSGVQQPVAPMASGSFSLNGPSESNGVQFSQMADAQRRKEDRILLEGKAKGKTYKEIRAEMETNVAESTLRGRYRSLTKPRKARVRKPIWQEKDIRLLKHVVRKELNRLDEGWRTATREQQLAKLSWKKVAEYISKNGGSYHFGNSTCKKKWMQIESCVGH